jgi:hypothetical protein
VLSICCYTDVVTLDPDQNETEYYQRIYSLFLDADTNSTTFEYDILVKPKEFFIFMWFYVAFSIIWTCISGAVIWGKYANLQVDKNSLAHEMRRRGNERVSLRHTGCRYGMYSREQ